MRCIPNRTMTGNVHAIGSEVGSNRIRLFRLMSRMEVKFGTTTGRLPRAASFIVSARSVNLGAFLSRRIRLCPMVLVQCLERSTREARCSRPSSRARTFSDEGAAFSTLALFRGPTPGDPGFPRIRILGSPSAKTRQSAPHFLSGTHLGFRTCPGLRSRTPAPPPFSSMNSTPAASCIGATGNSLLTGNFAIVRLRNLKPYREIAAQQ